MALADSRQGADVPHLTLRETLGLDAKRIPRPREALLIASRYNNSPCSCTEMHAILDRIAELNRFKAILSPGHQLELGRDSQIEMLFLAERLLLLEVGALIVLPQELYSLKLRYVLPLFSTTSK